MSEPAEGKVWKRLLEVAKEGDAREVETYLEELDDADRVHALAQLDSEELGRVLTIVSAEHAAELLEEIPDAHAAEAVGELHPHDAAEILEELWSDERADIVARLDADEADAIIAEATPETTESLRHLLQYPSDTAGGLMQTEFVAVPASLTAQEVIEHLRENVERYADFALQYVYALGERGELVGVLPLRDLLLARRKRTVDSLMISNPISVRALTPLQDLFELFDQYEFLGIPVTDDEMKIEGVLLREDVDEARVDQAVADELKSRGIISGEELRSLPLLTRSRRRLAWLSLNILLNIAAASVIALYQDTLQAAIALAVFLPIISDMSGCSGNQAVAVSLRELSLGVARPSDALRIWWKEASIGCLNGLALGCLIGGAAWLWKGNLALALVVGAALGLNTLVAVSIGGVVPLVLRRFGFDPALASGPILTTVTDMCGFLLVLSFATFALAKLAAV
ncbi:MAG: magnesium transporter [Deltaproteobacteria bacterium]|nr:magnesium transporter [Deltaproteobacteria bacterium]MBW2542708.1 magnesium transporter [Deltaproteobacteria bacterium]